MTDLSNIRWVSVGAIVVMHDMLIAEHGGAQGMLHSGGLSAALGRVQSHIDYANPEPSLTKVAAVYAHSIATGHYFVDGNKRTAAATARVFLKRNGVDFTFDKAEWVALILGVAEGQISVEEINSWLEARCTSPA